MWKKRFSKAGIETFTKPHNSSAVDWYKGVMEVTGDIELYKQIFLDIEYYPQVFHTTVEAHLVAEPKPGERVVYVVNKSPGAKARDYYARCTWQQSAALGVYRFHWVTEPGYKTEKGKVRIPSIEVVNELAVKPGSGCIEVSHAGHVEPGGMVPAMVINRLLSDIPWQTLFNIRQHIQTGRYHSQVHL